MAKYGFVFFNFQSGQVAAMPKAFLAHFPKAGQPG